MKEPNNVYASSDYFMMIARGSGGAEKILTSKALQSEFENAVDFFSKSAFRYEFVYIDG